MQSGLIVILIIAAVILICRAHELSVEKQIKSNVRYCETEPLGGLICLLNCELPKAYRISNKEETNAHKILEHYREDIAQKFIKDGYTRECATMSEHDFFMRTLYIFLDKRCCHYQLEGQHISEYKSRVNSYTSQYFLTDFGVVFYKLFLAASTYNQKSGVPFVHTTHIYNALDTCEFEVMTYMP